MLEHSGEGKNKGLELSKDEDSDMSKNEDVSVAQRLVSGADVGLELPG